MTALEEELFAVAVIPPAVAPESGPLASENSQLMCPAPVPAPVWRTVCPTGAVQDEVAAVLSDQYWTAQDPLATEEINGVTCAARLTVSDCIAKDAALTAAFLYALITNVPRW